MENQNLPKYKFKLVLLGETAVGKSSIVQRYVKDKFLDNQESTIGAAFLTQTVPLEKGIVQFDIWDTAGQERYHSLAPMYYRGAKAALVVYDITSRITFNRAKNWVAELQQNSGNPDMVIGLAGNKCDLEQSREVPVELAQEYAKESGVIYMETSAKTAQNIHELFIQIAERLPLVSAAPQNTISQLGVAPQEKKKCC
ncbi:hypothetical protein WA158_000645 [Blastocystis sp. Blastoise]